MTICVALDIETTGLDPNKDAIIEIGAVKFNDNELLEEWETLLNPGRPIPSFITNLTGIQDEMVVKAPFIGSVYRDLVAFVGDAPVVGHNIAFDLAFLRKRGGFLKNPVIDTYDLASIILPTQERYNLAALSEYLNLGLPAQHRALLDARATHGLYSRLMELAEQLPIELVAEIVRMTEQIEWGGAFPFQQVLRTLSRMPMRSKKAPQRVAGPLFDAARKRIAPALQPAPAPRPLNIDEAAAFLEPHGVFSRLFPSFENRSEQVELLRSIGEAFSYGHHLMAEAGTGTGKSLAYLIPAALWALANQHRVIISTNTINLQDQLVNKDIPDVAKAVGGDLRWVILKGRSNYLCPRRLENLRRRPVTTIEEARVLGKILVWLQSTTTGDRSEITLNGPQEREVWSRLSAEDPSCTSDMCTKTTGGACPFHRSRQSAQSAHLIIVNHALLLADMALGSLVLPEYEYAVIDEAHHLEDATTNALTFRVTQSDIERILREAGGVRSGLIGRMLTQAMNHLTPEDYGSLASLADKATTSAFQIDQQMRAFFSTMDHFLFEIRHARNSNNFPQQERLLPSSRTQPAWMEVEATWDELATLLRSFLETLTKINQGVSELTRENDPEIIETYSALLSLTRRFADIFTQIEALVFKPLPDRVYWIEQNGEKGRLSLKSAPLQIGELMREYLWEKKTSVILTSATLTAAGEFDYMRQRLGAEDVEEVALGSPFDYESSALLYLVNDIPEPSDKHGHQRAVEHILVRLAQATGGRALVLFTSYDQLKRTSRAISPVLERAGIMVLEQGEGASASALLDTFKTTPQAVLLGTRSFWEGVDVPGEALSILVIVKLPFDVPSDPVIAARSETYEDAFYEYALPEAILRFRQGFGRLIRTQFDRGAVIVLDKRILTKKYGKLFLDSLPPCTLRQGPASDVPNIATRWLNI